MSDTPLTNDQPPVRELRLRRRRSRVPWIYLVYHRKQAAGRRQPAVGERVEEEIYSDNTELLRFDRMTKGYGTYPD